MWTFMSGEGGHFCPGGMDLSVHPFESIKCEFSPQFGAHLHNVSNPLFGNSSPLPCPTNNAISVVLDCNGHKSLFFQGSYDPANLPLADTEERCEILIGSEASSFVIKTENFNE